MNTSELQLKRLMDNVVKILPVIEFLLKISIISMLVGIIQRETPQEPVPEKEKLIDYINSLIIDF